ncbi:MAG TPA: hypothetical protein VMH77_01095 [Steroidobacteraceae bacterium]|nr:hypothetical protein [Steroidobacteraceae bacterium]
MLTRRGAFSRRELKQYWHFDFHVLQVLLQRGWGVGAGLVTLLLVAARLSSVEQGYYYTFASLLALQVFFELGLNFVVTQIAGHEAARLTIAGDGLMQGDADSAARLQSLTVLLKRWYLWAAPVFAIALIAGGFIFFRRDQSLPPRQWAGPWLMLVIFTAVNLYLSPHLAIMEGIGRVGQVARLRLYQAVAGSLLLWVGFGFGLALWAVPSVSGVAALMTWIWLMRHGRLRMPNGLGKTGVALSWRQDVFPLQWKIALSWLSGWFISNAFVPMLFAHRGAVEAGRLGLALSMFNAVSALGMSWVNAAAPQFMRHIALGERAALNQLFRRVLLSSISFVLMASLAAVGGVAILKYTGFAIVERVASLPVLACLMLVTVANGFIFAAAAYMRAHKEEPMLLPSVVGGVITGSLAWFGSRYGTLPMMAIYAASTFCLGVPWAALLFLRYLRRRQT